MNLGRNKLLIVCADFQNLYACIVSEYRSFITDHV